MSKVLKMPLKNYFHNLFEDYKRKQDELLKKKTEFLYQEAYRYFLDLYLMRVAKEEIIDLPAFMYETGRVICNEAKANAERAMCAVIEANRINYCYSKRIKEIKKFAAV